MKKAILHDLFIMEIQDLYSAEQQLIEALPMMADSAHDPDLKAGFEKHLAQTQDQATRLEQLADELDFEVEGEECMGMEGLIEEGQEIMDSEFDDERIADLALIGAAQRIEHYEIAGYGTARALAEQMGHDQAVKLLDQTLDEESETDEMLTKAAEAIYTQIEE